MITNGVKFYSFIGLDNLKQVIGCLL